MAECYGLLVGLSGGEMAAKSFDVMLYEGFETLDGSVGEVGIEGAAEGAVMRMGSGVLDILWSSARNS